MKKAPLIAMLMLFVAFYDARADSYDFETLWESGDPSNTLDVVILGDGYRAEEREAFVDHVDSFFSGIFSQTPYREYRGFFNVYRLFVASNESGADYGDTTGGEVDTAFDCTFYTYGIQRLLTCDAAKAQSIAAQPAPDVDFVFILVNDSMYGGSGGAAAQTASVHPMATEIVAHELAHELGGLSDEYSDAVTPGAYPAHDHDPNVTFETERDEIPWTLWIEDDTPLPTPVDGSFSLYRNVVGLFEGARYSETPGMYDQPIYRPKFTCKMRELQKPFCPVCAEAMIGGIHEHTFLSDLGPETITETMRLGDAWDWSVPHKVPDPDEIAISWRVNGEEVGNAELISFNSTDYGVGRHVLEVELYDRTTLMRNPQFSDLSRQIVRWEITVEDRPSTDGDEDLDDDADSEHADITENSDDEQDEEDTGESEEFNEIIHGEYEDDFATEGETPGATSSGGCQSMQASEAWIFGVLWLGILAFRRVRQKTACLTEKVARSTAKRYGDFS